MVPDVGSGDRDDERAAYYDTQPLPNRDSADVHGWAPIYSLAVIYHTESPRFFRLTANQVNPIDNIAVNTLSIGVGYRLGQTSRSKQPAGEGVSAATRGSKSEFTVFIGQSVVNTFVSESAVAAGVEYRRELREHCDWTVGWIYKGDPEIVRRNGLATQIRVVR